MENIILKREKQRRRRVLRVRKEVRGSADRPRMSVYKTNRNISVQIINDVEGKTIASAGTLHKSFEGTDKRKSKESAKLVGIQIAKIAKSKGVEKVVFDRGRLKFHGIIAELANAAREAGLQF